jgi:hypothetical protein
MKRLLTLILVFTAAILFNQSYAQDAKERGLEAITERAVKGQLEFLASDWTEGRHTGRPGAYMAADYIASLFKVYGLQPGGDMEYSFPSRAERMAGARPTEDRTYFQSFGLIEYKAGENHELALVDRSAGVNRTTNFEYQIDFSVRTSDVSIDMEMPVIFAGYGFSNEESGYDDFKGLDVKGKAVIYLGGYPGYLDPSSKAHKTFNKNENISLRRLSREKSNKASELGAAAIIEIDPEWEPSDSWAANLPFRYNSGNYEGEKPRASYYENRMKLPGDSFSGNPTVITISPRVLNELLKDTGVDLEVFAQNVKNSLKPASRALTGKSFRLKTTVDSKMIRARNVVGVLPGKDTSEIIVVGAHYDHLGIHDGWIWNGADDNASGTVGVMTLAKAFMAAGEQPEKTIVFAAWTGEEKGLLGSEYFADHPYNDAKMILNLNYDMISRDDSNDTLGVKCSMVYTKKYSTLKEFTDHNNEEYGLGLDIAYRPAERPRGGSDHTSFSQKDVPVIYFMAGDPPEYHQHDDHVDLVNWDKLVNIIKIGYLNIWDAANTEWGPE